MTTSSPSWRRSAWIDSLRSPWVGKRGTQAWGLGMMIALILAQSLRESWAQGIGLIAALFALAMVIRHRQRLPAQLSTRPLWVVLGCLALYFAIHAVRIERKVDLHTLDGPARFLLLSPLLFLPWVAGVRWQQLTGYLALTGMIFGVTAAIGVFHPVYESRAFGFFTYYNLYGYASTALFGLLVVSAPHHRSRWAWALGLIGCTLALVISGTRGAWLALPLLLVLGIRHLLRSSHPVRNVSILAATLAILASLAWPMLNERVHVVGSDLSQATSDTGKGLNSSVGYRMAMWSVCAAMIQEKPWAGQGLSVFPEQMQPWADRLGLNVSFPGGGFQNPHNQYLGWAATQGIPLALVLLALVWVVPVLQGAKLRQPGDEWPSLLLLIGMTAIFCLTESVIERQRGAAWFTIWLTLLLGSMAFRAPEPSHGVRDGPPLAPPHGVVPPSP